MNCQHCGSPLGTLKIFCHPCYMKLPHKERSSLRQMTMNKQDTTTKVEKCLRILREAK